MKQVKIALVDCAGASIRGIKWTKIAEFGSRQLATFVAIITVAPIIITRVLITATDLKCIFHKKK